MSLILNRIGGTCSFLWQQMVKLKIQVNLLWNKSHSHLPEKRSMLRDRWGQERDCWVKSRSRSAQVRGHGIVLVWDCSPVVARRQQIRRASKSGLRNWWADGVNDSLHSFPTVCSATSPDLSGSLWWVCVFYLMVFSFEWIEIKVMLQNYVIVNT